MTTNTARALTQQAIENHQIDWNSSPCSINIFVELPFWLRMPDHSTTISNEDADVNVHISNTSCIFLSDSAYLPSHINIVAITDHESQDYYDLLDIAKYPHLVHKKTRTMIRFESQALSSVLNQVFGSECTTTLAFGNKYLRVLVAGHIEFLNQLIEKYRGSVFDPFVYPVREKDVPVWFVEYNKKLYPVHIFNYLAFDSVPIMRNAFTGEPVPFSHMINNPELVWSQNCSPMPPESRSIYNAWTNYYYGDYVGAIRSAVTGIEVAIDRCLSEAKKKLGETSEEIDAYFRDKSNSFEKRFRDYYSTKKRHSPIIIPFMPMELLCYDCKEEIFAMRRLRHDIVHQGHFLSTEQKRVVYTYLDVIMPAFLSIVGENNFPEAKDRVQHFLFGDNIDHYEIRYTNRRIDVFDPHQQYIDSGNIENYTYTARNKEFLCEYIDKNNIDFFTFASFLLCTNMQFTDEMELSMTEDKYDERLRLFDYHSHSNHFALAFAVFVSQNSDLLSEDIPRVIRRMGTGNFQGTTCHPIVLLDTQNAMLLKNREMDGNIDQSLVSISKNNNITLITVPMMQLLNYGYLDNFWNSNDIISIFRIPGLITSPPKYTFAGKVRCHFTNLSVLSVVLSDDIRVGDNIIIWNFEAIYSFSIMTLQKNNRPTTSGKAGETVGMHVGTLPTKIHVGATVFKCKKASIESVETN